MTTTAQPKPRYPQILNLRRKTDKTIYAYMCLNCGGSWKLYQNPICLCGAVSSLWAESVEGEWRKVEWNGKPWRGEL